MELRVFYNNRAVNYYIKTFRNEVSRENDKIFRKTGFVFVFKFYSKLEAMIVLNGPIIVDTFFIISGFLACYLLLEHIQKNPKAFQIPLFYIHRYVRYTGLITVVKSRKPGFNADNNVGAKKKYYCNTLVVLGPSVPAIG